MTKPHNPATESNTVNASPSASGDSLDLPHERDQQGQTAREPDPMMVQAKKDLDAGLVDTELRNKPGVDAANMPKNLKHIPKS